MEILLIRIDHFADRKQYLSILRAWLSELHIKQGRVISMGALQLLIIVSTPEQNTRLLEFYATKNIDVNSRQELCVDRFIDVLGRKSVDKAECKGFLEMNILNRSLLEQMLVQEWKGEKQWLDTALETDRTKTFIEWREAAKAARKERRKRSAQEAQAEKELKKQHIAVEEGGAEIDAEKAASEETLVEDRTPPAEPEAVPLIKQGAQGKTSEKKPQQKKKNPEQKQQPANQLQQKQQQPKQQMKPEAGYQQKQPVPLAHKKKAQGSVDKRPRKRARHAKK